MKKFRRIGAVVVIILLLSLYLICLIAAVSGSENARMIFRVTLGMTVAVPVLLYALILLLKLAKNKEQKAQELVDESLKQAKAVPEDETDSPEHTEA